MCSVGKKGKKKKGKTVDLWSFLAEGSGPTPNIPLKSSNWVDDVEDDHGKPRESSSVVSENQLICCGNDKSFSCDKW